MARTFTTAELSAYLDEALPADLMASVESELRSRPAVAEQLAQLISRRDAGVHTLGDIWRRHRLSCPSRQELGSYLMGVLTPSAGRYVAFHLDEIGCPICRASAQDLREQQAVISQQSQRRRQRIFQSSAGHLRRK